MLVLVVVVIISGCSSPNSHNNTTNYKNYSGKTMSFQYPNDWILSENGTAIGNISNDLTVFITKGDSEIDVQVLSLDDPKSETINIDSINAISNGYLFKGVFKNNNSNINCKVYTLNGNNTRTLYLFKKGNKTFEILGNNQNLDVMNKILETIQ